MTADILIPCNATEFNYIKRFLCPNGEKVSDVIKKLVMDECKNRQLFEDLVPKIK
jgi:hypothetical protein